MGISDIPGLQDQLDGVLTWQILGTLPSLAQKSAGSANSCRICCCCCCCWDCPLAAGIVHTLLEERPMNGSSLMKEHCLFLPRKGWGSHPIGRSLGKLFLSKRRRLPGGEGPSAWPSCPSSEPFRFTCRGSAGVALCSFSSVRRSFYFLCQLLIPTSFHLPTASFSQVYPAH